MTISSRFSKTRIISWCMFDFASTIFMMNIVSLAFVQWLDHKFGNGDSKYAIISAIMYGLSIILYPFAGRICDQGWKLIPLFLLTMISVTGTFFIGFSQNIWQAGCFFILAYLTYQLALTYYNALLNDITSPEHFGKISGYGVAARYLGTIVGLFSIDYFIQTAKHSSLPGFLHFLLLKIDPTKKALYVNAFIPTALMYFLFTIPLFIIFFLTRAGKQEKPSVVHDRTLLESLKDTLQDRSTRFLLLTLFFGGMPVYASIHFMSVILKKIGDVPDGKVIGFLIFATIFSILGGLLFGFALRKVGNKKIFNLVMLLWTAIFAFGIFIHGNAIMWPLVMLAGTAMGGYWVSARVLVLDLAPKGKEGEYMALFGAVIVVCGLGCMLLWWLGVAWATSWGFSFTPQRMSMLLLALAGIIGIFTFIPVRFPKT